MNSDKIRQLDIAPGDRLLLEGRTLKLKNRIREHGDVWEVLKIGSPFGADGILVMANGDSSTVRWIHDEGDVLIVKKLQRV